MKPCRLYLLCLFIVLSLVPPPLARAQDPKFDQGDKLINAYLAAETDKLSKKFLDGAKTLKEWQEKRPELHRQYMEMLGLWPAPKKSPLKATITGSFEHEGVVIDNLHYQSVPGLYVTANFYRPKGNSKKLPTILYVCGHSNKGRDGNKSAYWEHGTWFARNGYNCLVLDTLQLGEIPGVHHGTYGVPWNHLKAYDIDGKNKPENRWWWVSRGYTPAGVECWNGIRGIDYLQSRPDVDADRIGVTGISGGGAATFWIAAADERVKVAVPVSGMSDLESYVKNKVINGHCDCMFLYNTYQWDWTTIAALVAPRPLLFANSDNDPLFPMDGNRRISEKLDRLYEMYGKADLFREYVSKGGHAYRPDLRVAIFKFLNKHLKHDSDAPVKDVDFKPIDAKKLRVFPTDAEIPKDALNAKIDEVFVPKADVKLPEKGKFKEWQTAVVGALRSSAFKPFPDRVPKPSVVTEGPLGRRYLTQPGILIHGFVEPISEKVGHDVIKITAERFILSVTSPDFQRDGKEIIPRLGDLIKPDKKSQVGSIEVRGDWSKKSPPNYVGRAHVLLGQTVDQGRVWDICAVAHFASCKVRLIGVGQEGILAAYAAVFEPNIDEIVIVDPPKSHVEGPTFLNVLKVLDIPEALGLLAPRKLTLIGAKDAAFDRVEEIYKLAGAADKLTRK